jgi:hypothetical protein
MAEPGRLFLPAHFRRTPVILVQPSTPDATMIPARPLILALVATWWFAAAAFAAADSPAGIWKWSVQGRQGGGAIEQTLRLEYKDGKLTGTLLGVQGGQFRVPDTPISDASFEDGQIGFSVTREINGNAFTTRYEGKLEGDTLLGTMERPGLTGGEPVKRDWLARRQPAPTSSTN